MITVLNDVLPHNFLGGTGGMNLRVRPRVNIGKNNYKIIFEHLSAIAPSRDKIKMFRYGKSA